MENPNTWTYLYYISCMIIAAAAVVGLSQLFILKHDIKTRYKRAAIEYSLKLINHYCEKIVKISDEIYDKEKEESIPQYEGTTEKLPDIDGGLVIKRLELLGKFGFHRLLYEFEYFSAGVLSSLCDEDLVFDTIGRAFCFKIARLYDIYKSFEVIGKEYKHTLELFELWRNRIKKKKLELEKKKLSAQQREIINKMQKLMDKRIPPIK